MFQILKKMRRHVMTSKVIRDVSHKDIWGFFFSFSFSKYFIHSAQSEFSAKSLSQLTEFLTNCLFRQTKNNLWSIIPFYHTITIILVYF